MTIQLGPILYAGQSDATTWRFSIQLVIDDPSVGNSPPFSVVITDANVTVGAPQLLANFQRANGWKVWKWPINVARAAAERNISYKIEDATGETAVAIDKVVVPKRGSLPRMALFSCNGFEKKNLSRDLDEPDRLWQIMADRHASGIDRGHPDDPSGLHLLIGSGDQIYADGIPTLADDQNGLHRLSSRQLRRLRPSTARETKALREYLALYRKVWGHESIAAVMARVPGVYTWDDHDIMDGWGSHRSQIQDNVAYQEVYRAARQAFLAFQLSGDPTEGTPPPLVYRTSAPGTTGDDHLLQTLSYRESDRWVDIVALDLRSDRTRDTVLSAAQWAALKSWLEQYVRDAAQATGVRHRHLLLVSSIPLVYLRFRIVNFVLGNLIPGAQTLEDDLIDQWEHRRHQGERDRLIMTLLRTHRDAGAQVTILSGDVHLAARGRIVSTQPAHLRTSVVPSHLENGESQATIQQIISSGIVHPPPSRLELAGIDLVSTEGPSEVSNGVISEMVDLDTQQSRLRARNFATLAFDNPQSDPDQGRLWIEWVAEDGVRRRQIVVGS